MKLDRRPPAPEGLPKRVFILFGVIAFAALVAATVAEPPAIGMTKAILVLGSLGLTGMLLVTLFSVLAGHRTASVVFPALAILLIAAARHLFGGSEAGISPLYLIPVVWVALFGTRAANIVVIALVAVALGTPIIIFGGPDYPVDEWRRFSTYMVIATGIALFIRFANRQASVDPLTGLGNRRAWDHAIAQQLSRSRRHGEAFMVAVLDIDDLGGFNDAHGHAAADALLVNCARVWREAVRPEDTLSRIGGDEFLLLLPAVASEESGVQVIRRLAAATPSGQTISAGLAEWNAEEDISATLRRADTALYVAKHGGRNRISVARGSGLFSRSTPEMLIPEPSDRRGAPESKTDNLD